MPQKDREAYNAYQREYQLKRYRKRMAQAKEILGNCCIICNTSDNLEIDHKDWRTKGIKLNKLWSISEVRFFKELEKCQLLCREHHIEKSRKDISQIRRIAEKKRKKRRVVSSVG